MIKLIESYRADPSDANAEKLAKYDRKHPMASCFLKAEDNIELKKAIEQHKTGKKFLTARPEPLF